MKIVPFIFFLFFSLVGFTQKNQSEQWYSTDTYDLPQNSIKSIVADKYGFLWLTTEKGIVRFDGKNFKIFNRKNSSFKGERFYFFYCDLNRDSIFTFNECSEEILINDRQVIINKVKDKNKVYKHYIDKIGSLNFLDGLSYPLVIYKNKNEYYEINKNSIFFVSKNKEKINTVNTHDASDKFLILDNHLICLKKDGNNYIQFNNKIESFKLNELETFYYNSINNQLFLYKENIIYKMEVKNHKMIYNRIAETKGLDNVVLNCIYYDDNSKKTFVGTSTRGLVVYSSADFKIVNSPPDMSNNFYSIANYGNIILANGVDKYNEYKYLNSFDTTDEQYTKASTIDKNGDIWVKSDKSIIRYLKKNNYKKKISLTFSREINSVFCDSKNRIWISFNQNGNENQIISYIDPTYNNIIKVVKTKYERTATNCFGETLDGIILLGSGKSLVFLDTKKNTIKDFKVNFDIRSIYICKNNRIWLCTYGSGFYLFENGKFILMPSDNTNSLETSHCIIEDDNGHFWISTNNGIIEANKFDLFEYAIKKTPVYYNHYDKNYGFNTNEFNGGCQPCGIKLANQNIAFPSIDGIITFNPKKINKTLPKNEFYVNEVILDENKKVLFKDEITIDREFDRIEFLVDFAYFGNQKNIVFEAFLNLNNKTGIKWVKVPDDRSISFTNLPPGKHTLFVRMKNGFGGKYSVKRVVIEVPYFFYETLWFKIVLTIFIILMLMLFFNFKNKKEVEKNVKLNKIIDSKTQKLKLNIEDLKKTKQILTNEILQQKKLIGTISHDIKSPLRFLNMTSKYLHNNIENIDIEEQKIQAKVIYESSYELLNFVDSLISYSLLFLESTENENVSIEVIEEIIVDKIKLFDNLAKAKSIKLIFDNQLKHKFEVNKKILSIIIHNLIDNSIKNTDSGFVLITAIEENEKVVLSIQDSGSGMENRMVESYMSLYNDVDNNKLLIQKNGLGLRMIIELLRLINAGFNIESKKDLGTTISIYLNKE